MADLNLFLPSSPDPDECPHNDRTEPVYGGSGEIVGFRCKKCGETFTT
jgi:transposase-like protein